MRSCCAHVTAASGSASPRALDEREARVLYVLAREGDATVAFQGLRHLLDLHQQKLTRTLRRLERDGLVARSAAGYRITEEGYRLLGAKRRGHEPSAACRPAACTRAVLPVLQSLVPPHADADALADALKGRWFKDLRWFAEARTPGETTLTWITADGHALLRVRVSAGAVTVEAEAEDDVTEHALSAVPSLLGALADALAQATAPAAPAAAS